MKNKAHLYFLSFSEGAAVMAAEIGGAKLIAPYFGSSLYVWSSVMAITLGGLAGGYFLGGLLSQKSNKEKKLTNVLMLAVSWLLLMPFISKLFIYFAHWSLIPAVISAVFLLLFPTMLFMGATSPLIIACLTKDSTSAGKNTGSIYAISTLGGIMATFLCGFYFIPTFGLMITFICFSALLLTAIILFSFQKKNDKSILYILIPISIALYSFINQPKNPYTIYSEEGIMGKLEIRDEPSSYNPDILIRKLLINNIIQTEMILYNHEPVTPYIKLLDKNLSFLPKGKALVLGLGGGITSNVLIENGYETEAVEFDPRISDAAKHFFFLNQKVITYNDDARHFLNQCNKKYQLILFDIFKAEEQPSYVITTESLEKIKENLDTNGIILINTHGFLNGEKAAGTQCLLSTLIKKEFNVKVCSTGDHEEYRNLLIYASLKPISAGFYNEILPLIIEHTEIINRDYHPLLDKLNATANQSWRENYLQNYILVN